MERLIEMTYPGLVTARLISRLLEDSNFNEKLSGYVGELRVIWDSDRLTIEGSAPDNSAGPRKGRKG